MSTTGRLSLVARTIAGAREALDADAATAAVSVDEQLQELDVQIAAGWTALNF